MTKHISSSILLTTIIAIIITITAFPAPSHSLSNTLTLDISTANETVQTAVTISGQLNVSSMPMQGAHIGIAVDNSNGTYIFADDTVTNSTGGYSTHFRLDNSNKGTYEAFASAYTNQTGSLLTTKYFSIGTCLEHWECSDWSQCKTNLKQTRTCIDTNQCGTEDIKPPLSRSCTPTCQQLAGEICSTSQVCSGTYIDASDTERCCDNSCRLQSSTGSSSSGGSTTTAQKTPDNKTTASSSSSGGSSAPKANQTETAANVPEETPDNVTANVMDNKTQEASLSQNARPNSAGGDAGFTMAGHIIGALVNNRWLIIDAILIVFIYLFGTKLFPGNIQKASLHTSNKNTVFRQYHKTPEFVYNYNPTASKKNTGNTFITKHRQPVQQNMQADPTIRKMKVNVSGNSRFGRYR